MERDPKVSPELARRVIEHLTGEQPNEVSIASRTLAGGLTSRSVLLVRVAYGDRRSKPRRLSFVVKQLAGRAIRERRIYEELVARHAKDLAPAVIGAFDLPSERSVLLLEAVRKVAWPWQKAGAAQVVLERLAAFHVATRDAVESPALGDWCYEDALEASAHETYEALVSCTSRPELSGLLTAAPATRRVVSSLRSRRKALLTFAPFCRCVVHGDVHPGNVLLRRRTSGAVLAPVLIDWERSRAGSPLEDVSSWLHSLGVWEPEARRRHDTIFGAYLSAMGLEQKLTPEIRAAYWIASASNALAGALRYHLALAQEESAGERARATAARAAFTWLRVLRRADAFSS